MRTLAHLLTLELQPRRKRHEFLPASTRASSVCCCTDATVAQMPAHTRSWSLGSFTQRTSWPSAKMRLAVDSIQESGEGAAVSLEDLQAHSGWHAGANAARQRGQVGHKTMRSLSLKSRFGACLDQFGDASAQDGQNAFASVCALKRTTGSARRSRSPSTLSARSLSSLHSRRSVALGMLREVPVPSMGTAQARPPSWPPRR